MALTLLIREMRCKGCAQHVVDAIWSVLPSARVRVDMLRNMVTVAASPTDEARVVAAIVDAGYEASVSEGCVRPDERFFARRAEARARLDQINPHLQRNGDPDDPFFDRWFATVYESAGEDAANIPWAALSPNPLLIDWLTGAELHGLRALDVGCGLGDNAEALSSAGADTTAFDYVERPIAWAKRRFPLSDVSYCVADLLNPPQHWRGAFDFVHECYTLQTMRPEHLSRCAHALAALLAPLGRLLVISSAREEDALPTTPWRPLSRREIEAIAVDGLALAELDDIPKEGCVDRRWRALFEKTS
jgi:2-polyprenyl-3-methyl-5-hydroxy-6-metoxy-1,4-benzoquinol methylase/copper chaperone CopZ